MAKAKAKSVSPPLYVGASECEFRPAWVGVSGALLPLLEAAYRSDPDDMTVLLVLADALEEEGDGRAGWVRLGVRLWEGAAGLVAGEEGWDEAGASVALDPLVETVPGWRVASLWGSLLAWHAPCGDGTGRVMGRTWVDERVRVVQRCVWFWGLGFLSDFGGGSAAWGQAYAAGRQADAAWGQAYAAGRQADAAGRQAYAAGRQADAAWGQADAAGGQADAAGCQAYAAGRQADAAGCQAYAAWGQASAAGGQASAAGGRVWKFARSLWDLCRKELNNAGEL